MRTKTDTEISRLHRPYSRGYDEPAIVWPPTKTIPPHEVAVRASYFRVIARPGVVWSARKGDWVPDTDEMYNIWKTFEWADRTEFATDEDLAGHFSRHGADRFGPRVRRALFLARELFAVLTDEDVATIQIALDAETGQAKSDKAAGRAPRTPLRLLWASLQAQGDAPIDVTDVRFQSGWAGIRQALTTARATEIATALNIREPA
jgi:hypothetical protein